jgi:hypothetical protein
MQQEKSCCDQPARLLIVSSTSHPLRRFPPLHLDVPHDGEVLQTAWELALSYRHFAIQQSGQMVGQPEKEISSVKNMEN